MSELYQIPSDIRNEFVVTEDGRVFAKSWRAVARLAGVGATTISERLLAKLKACTPEDVPTSLKPLAGKDLRLLTEIDEVTISCIVSYYAWESQQGCNDTAKCVALALQAMGTRGFFQREYGWHDPKTSELSEVKSLIVQMLGKMSQMESKLEIFETTGAKFPGITNIIQNTTNNNILILPPDFKEPFSIRDWVKVTQSRVLTSGQCRSIGRMASGTMTTLKLETPIKYATGKVYHYSDMPALVTIYQSWKLTNK